MRLSETYIRTHFFKWKYLLYFCNISSSSREVSKNRKSMDFYYRKYGAWDNISNMYYIIPSWAKTYEDTAIENMAGRIACQVKA